MLKGRRRGVLSHDEIINYATKMASSLLLPPGELGKPREDVKTVHE